MEYEQNRDMSSRILELEASLSALEKDLKRVQDREAAAKLAAEKATEEVNQLKEEVKGIFDTCVCCMILIENHVEFLFLFGFAIFYSPFGLGMLLRWKLGYLGRPFAIFYLKLMGTQTHYCFILFMFSSFGISFFNCSLSTLEEWKSKSEDCEKEIQEWKKKASAATTNISKLNRLIHSKVRCTIILVSGETCKRSVDSQHL